MILPDMTRDTSWELNSLIDAADLLGGTLSSDQTWLNAVALMQSNGFTALNVVEFDRTSGQALWLRSSMKAQWLADYVEQDFMTLDPLILAACNGQNEIRMSEGKVLGIDHGSAKMKSLADQVVNWGYGALDCQIFDVLGQSHFKGVVVSKDENDQTTGMQHRLVCAVVSAAITAPLSPDSAGATILPPNLLTTREVDVLSFLASGLRNDAIAWKMNIAEVTVRAHLASARRKLGAATREEAVALAIRSGQLPI
jgi:DNA-binding CsgD family transcriptional regulator